MANNEKFSIPDIKLNNGEPIPQVGLGLWQVQNEQECKDAIQYALEVGYRHFDSAQIYENEAFLGDVLSGAYNSGQNISREDIFITTKLWNENQSSDLAMSSFEKSLVNLQTEYVDLFLVHFPVTETREQAWKTLETIYNNGQAKAIGVSNYTVTHLEELLKNTDIIPAVNQVEIHVFLQQKELRAYCDEKGIIVEAYSPIAHGEGLDTKELIEIGQQYSKTSAQVMLKWCAQNNMVVLPKSVTPSRISENADIFDFELSSDDLEIIDSLEKDFRTCWDPSDVK